MTDKSLSFFDSVVWSLLKLREIEAGLYAKRWLRSSLDPY